MSNEQRLSDVLSQFARTMVTDFPIQSILDRLVESIVEVLPITSAGVTLISPGTMPRYVAASDDSALCFEELQTELGEGPCLSAYHTGEAVAVPDLRGEIRFPNFAPRALVAGLAAVFTFPLRHSAGQLGALDLYRDTPGTLSHKAMTDAQTLADVAAAYLLNAQGRADLLDVSERARAASLHDALTGLPNRTLILERLEHAIVRHQRSDKTAAVLFIDLDRFKAVNDTYGHRVGDELLIAVAERLVELIRPCDTAARLYGDEFVILLEDLEAASQATPIVARVKAALARPFVVSGLEIQMTASVGIAVGDDFGLAGKQLLDDADVAMYKAKRGSGHGVGFLDLHQQHLTEHHVGLECDLHWALGRGELHTVYQPIVAAASRRITGVEALLRWVHPTQGLVSPTVLIPLAEQSGLIVEIGQWVLEQAWADRYRSQGQIGSGELAMSVNVSTQQLMLAGFAASVAAVLATGQTDPGLLTLEMTESAFLRDNERRDCRAQRPQGHRRQARHRRLRHWLLIAQLPRPVPHRRREARPVIRRRLRTDRGQPHHRGRRHSARPRPWHDRRGRRRGNRGTAPRGDATRLRFLSGLLLRQTDARPQPQDAHARPRRRRRPAAAGGRGR